MGILNLNKIKLNDAINYFTENEEITLETYCLTNTNKTFICELLRLCLEEIGKEDTYSYLNYCIIELLENSNRANVKRIFFLQNELNILDDVSYAKGMKTFNINYRTKRDYFSQLLKENNFYVRTTYKIKDQFFLIQVRNNSVILNQELKIVSDKINSAKEFNSVDEVVSIVNNTSNEGAGLGIIITVLMLNKIGLSKDAIDILKTDTETICTISIPLTLITFEKNQIINDVIVKEINKIPQFSENIVKLQKLISNPDVKINEVINIIKNDPSLIAEIFRFANLSLFSNQGKISNLVDAVKIIGLEKLKKLLYSYGTKELLEKMYDTKKIKKIWKTSNKVAFFAFHIAKKYFQTENLEDIYISAILHDIGSILLLGINPELLTKLTIICQKKSIPLRVIEDLTSGYNHAIIGAAIAKKWKFPEKFIQVINYHNNPLNCDDKYENIVYCVYLSTMIALAGNQKNIYNEIFTSILYFFNITSFETYKILVDELNLLYNNSKNGYNFE